jgi:hypothetical protein
MAAARVAISASADTTIRVWYFDNLDLPPLVLTDHKAPVLGCAALRGSWPDPMRFVSWDADNIVRAWTIDLRRAVSTPMAGHSGRINGVAVDYQREIVYSCSDDETVRAWSFKTGESLGLLYGARPFRSIAAINGAVCAGDEAGSVWVLSYDEASGSAANRSSPSERPRRILIMYFAENDEFAARLRRTLVEISGIPIEFTDTPRDVFSATAEQAGLEALLRNGVDAVIAPAHDLTRVRRITETLTQRPQLVAIALPAESAGKTSPDVLVVARDEVLNPRGAATRILRRLGWPVNTERGEQTPEGGHRGSSQGFPR